VIRSHSHQMPLCADAMGPELNAHPSWGKGMYDLQVDKIRYIDTMKRRKKRV